MIVQTALRRPQRHRQRPGSPRRLRHQHACARRPSSAATLGQPLLFREALAALYDVVVSDFKYRPARPRWSSRPGWRSRTASSSPAWASRAEGPRAASQALEARLGELDARPPRAAAGRSTGPGGVLRLRLQERSTSCRSCSTRSSPSTPTRCRSRRSRATRAPTPAWPPSTSCSTRSTSSSAARPTSTSAPGCTASWSGCAPTAAPGSTSTRRASRSPPTGGRRHKEKKIDLPESWVMGFLQVHSTMSLGLTRFRMAPVDLFNIVPLPAAAQGEDLAAACATSWSRASRVRAVLEPWEHVIELSPRSTYEGPKPMTVRTWGRDRLRTLARLLPVCRRDRRATSRASACRASTCSTSGRSTFTLALSGWTDNDWTGGAAQVRPADAAADGQPAELTQIYEALRTLPLRRPTASWRRRPGLGVEKARSALSYLCQVGRAMFDLAGGVYRHRDLFPEPFSAQEAAAGRQARRRAGERPQEEAAERSSTRATSGSSRGGRSRPATSSAAAPGRRTARACGRCCTSDHEGRIIEGRAPVGSTRSTS